VSNINYLSINENFPVAGQDNDTQVFRDNFDTIKTGLRVSKEEITDLQDNAVRKDNDNDFSGKLVQNAILQNVSLRKKDYGEPLVLSVSAIQEISFNQALYHLIRFGAACRISFTEFPAATVSEEGLSSIGKATLELYGDGTARTITFTTEGGIEFRKNSSGAWGGSAENPTIVVTSATNPVIVEVWQHSLDNIFLNYIGQFS
jgi:hypothetical protein